jgi:ABC-type transport system substrate-binding protein
LSIKVNLEYYNNEEFLSEVIKNKDFDVIFFGLETQKDPDRYVNWHSTGINNGYNFTSFKNGVADKALEDGRSELDLKKRIADYNKFQESFNEVLPAIFIFHPYTNYYISNRVSGIGSKYTFDITDRYLDFSNWLIN